MSIKIDAFNLVPGVAIDAPHRVIAKRVLRDHNRETVVVVVEGDDECITFNFNDRVSLVGLDPNLGLDGQPIGEVNIGELTAEGWGGERIIPLDGVRDTLGDINHTLRESADRDTIDIIEDASRAIMLGIGLTADETPDDVAIHNALDILGAINATALADIQAAVTRAYGHGPHLRAGGDAVTAGPTLQRMLDRKAARQ